MALIWKSSATTRTNNTLAADPDITTSLSAQTYYRIIANCRGWSNATADFKYKFNYTGTFVNATGMLIGTIQPVSPGSWTGGSTAQQNASRQINPGWFLTSSTAATIAGTATSTDEFVLYLEGFFFTDTGGTFSLDWAQNVTTGGSNTRVSAGSWMLVTPLAVPFV